MKKQPRNWLIFSGLAFQIGIVMYIMVYLGSWIQEKWDIIIQMAFPFNIIHRIGFGTNNYSLNKATEVESVISPLIKFSAKLFLLMIGLYWFHIFVINQIGFSVQDDLLKACYLFNTLIALVFYYLLLLFQNTTPQFWDGFFCSQVG